ncbi:PRC-barrel domain-containing protein [Halomonas sp. McH1-25]|uniref:PRC-barrel domain-containing protein n=1 Tax=unclassified Halomonas TaxID=2609666 RepID=UPI001EF57D9B|nr:MULTISPECIES: PRC-barrel domain-containing protein [unclassified Halomonas]MCG7599988.1 PRC-barrel domain-containing protein [Halomonas sp. McH1-25]MCP1343399.1 PRC-barrel domain-containing protein [Halomonas sp. FL8]MCP1360444.1 PRC-barrel domain-containing protein [Halomonas sp. BBD45]MCP1363796.1 PRC-barrel domain-containing protein [Halomonas sp. BBD48]
MEKKLKLCKLSLQIAAASAAGASLAITPAFAQQSGGQQSSGQMEQRASAEFDRLDQNGDQLLQWDELEQRLSDANVQQNRDQVLSEYDRDSDQALSLSEFQPLMVVIAEAEGDQSMDDPEEVVVESQQPKVVVDTDPPDVNVDPAEPDVTVDQQPPQVEVDPSEPQVTVDQQKPKVIVTQPKPTVEVTVPDPEVEVVMRDPNVQVDTNKPDVEVVQQKPEVTVNQGQPDVNVERSEPEVAVQPAKPRVAVDGQEQADVAVRDEGQAQVEVESADPNVSVSDAEANVSVEEAEGANVQVTEGEQQQQNSGSQNALYALLITDIQGQSVFDTSGNELGEVDQVVTSNDTNEVAVVVTRGGVLGFGQEEIIIPLNEMQMNNDQLVWQTDLSVDEMKQEQYNEADYTVVTDENMVLRDAGSM